MKRYLLLLKDFTAPQIPMHLPCHIMKFLEPDDTVKVPREPSIGLIDTVL